MKLRPVWVVLAALAAIYGLVVLLFFSLQDKLMFIPETRYLSPAEAGVTGAEELTIATPDGERLRAWYATAEPNMPTVLFLHGNAGSIADRGDRFTAYQSHGYGVLFIDYRGFGGSSGRPSEAGLLTDAAAAYDWLTQVRHVEPRRIVLLGESLGTGVAVMLAARRPVAAVALEAAYTSIEDVAARHYWWLPVRLLIGNRFHADRAVGEINAPLLIMHGEADATIPIAFGRRLFELARQPKTFVPLPGTPHVFFSDAIFTREDAFYRAAIQ